MKTIARIREIPERPQWWEWEVHAKFFPYESGDIPTYSSDPMAYGVEPTREKAISAAKRAQKVLEGGWETI